MGLIRVLHTCNLVFQPKKLYLKSLICASYARCSVMILDWMSAYFFFSLLRLVPSISSNSFRGSALELIVLSRKYCREITL